MQGPNTAPLVDNDVCLPMRERSHSDTESEASPLPSFTFVTISNPSEARDSGNRYLVRSRASKNYMAKQKRQRIMTSKRKVIHRLDSKNNINEYRDIEVQRLKCLTQVQFSSFSKHKDSRGITHQRSLSLLEAARHLLCPNPKSVLGAGRVDPFSSYPRVLNYYEHLLLSYYITDFCPKNDPLYSAEFSNALSRIWLPEAIKDRGLLDGMLLITGRDFMQVAPSKEIARLILQLRGRLILDVKKIISDNKRAVTDVSIGTLLQLAFDEIATGNWKDLATHTKGLNSIIQSRGHLATSGFSGFLTFLIARVNLICALYKQPESPHQSTTKSTNYTSVENLKSGFLANDIIQNLSTQMIAVLDNYSALSDFLDRAPGAALPPVGSFSIEGTLVDHELGLKSVSAGKDAAASIFDEPSIEECMIIAAGVYRSRILYEDDPSDAHSQYSASQMEIYISSIARLLGSSKRFQYLPLLLWMAFIGGLSLTPAPANPYWPRLMHDVAKELRITTWEETRSILKIFLWSDQRCENLGRDLWDQVEQIELKSVH